MALEGELIFTIENEEDIPVKAGEVIAIPANARHGAYTKDKSAKVVDAWSPVRETFLSK